MDDRIKSAFNHFDLDSILGLDEYSLYDFAERVFEAGYKSGYEAGYKVREAFDEELEKFAENPPAMPPPPSIGRLVPELIGHAEDCNFTTKLWGGECNCGYELQQKRKEVNNGTTTTH